MGEDGRHMSLVAPSFLEAVVLAHI